MRINSLRVLIVLTILFTAAGGAAGDNEDVLPLMLVPAVKELTPLDTEIIEFQGRGHVQRVGKDEVGKNLIVIDDRLFYLSGKITYYDADGKPASKLFFTPGREVGYFFNDQRELTALHLIASNGKK